MSPSHSQEDGDNRKVLILFHSGSGSTRTISEVFREKLSESYTVDMIQVGSSVNYRDRLHILGDRCTNCNLCVENCERGSWVEGEERPSFNPMNCEFCLECVHNCPKKAIIFSEKMKDRPRLNKAFYRKLKTGLLGDQEQLPGALVN